MSTVTGYARLVEALEAQGSVVKESKLDRDALAQCPAHDDREPSLHITDPGEGRVLLYCHAGCRTEDVLAALNLTWGDTFDNGSEVTYTYEDGRVVHRRPGKRFHQSGNTKGPPVLYRLTELRRAIGNGRTAYVVEGESDVHALTKAGRAATCSPGGAGNWHKVDASPLLGARVVVVVRDKDEAGQAYADAVLDSLKDRTGDTYVVEAKQGKDISDHLGYGHALEDLVVVMDPDRVRARPGQTTGQQESTTSKVVVDQDGKIGAFTVITLSDVKRRKTVWLIPGLLPAGDVVVAVGEEGIGKGLWWIAQVKRVTDAGRHVVLIVAEDDPERALGPRLDAAGVDSALVHLIVKDRESLTGHPYLPTHTAEVRAVIEHYDAALLIIDPWVSVVPGTLVLRDTQQAREALDPLTVLARQTDVCILAVAHTNRTNGSTRDRVSLTAVLRQVARVLILALEDPADDTVLLVGIDKANNTTRGSASSFTKSGQGDAWRVTVKEEDTGKTIREWDHLHRTDSDGRTGWRWREVRDAADFGMITRADVVKTYEGNTKAADKAIGRWIKTGRLNRREDGIYEIMGGSDED